jgi:hypothetical protein
VKDLMKDELVPKFLAVNKCPDFIEDKGHEFGKNAAAGGQEGADRAVEDVLRTMRHRNVETPVEPMTTSSSAPEPAAVPWRRTSPSGDSASS